MKSKNTLDREAKIREGIIKFENSNRTADDYIELFVAAHLATRPDAGLQYSRVKEIIEEVKTEIEK